jgi:soluble lytic murein transglycosylase-like protein
MEDPAFIRPDRSTARRRSRLLILALCCGTLWVTDATVRRINNISQVAVQPISTVTQPQVDRPVAVQNPPAQRAQVAAMPPGPLTSHPEYTRQVHRTAHLYHSIIQQVARRYKIDPAMVRAIIMAESGYNPQAVSHRGAQGLMQLMPETADMFGVSDSFDPEHNITAGVRYFRQLMDLVADDPALALAAYNAGPANVRRYNGIPPYETTRRYVKKVLAYYRCYRHVRQMEGLTRQG